MDNQAAYRIQSFDCFEKLDIELHRIACCYSLRRYLGASSDTQLNKLLEASNMLDQLQADFDRKKPSKIPLHKSSDIESWLLANELKSSGAKKILNSIPASIIEINVDLGSNNDVAIPADSAWNLAAVALSEYLPVIAHIIDQVFTEASRNALNKLE